MEPARKPMQLFSIPPYVGFAFQLLRSLRTRDWASLFVLSLLLAAAPIATLFIIQFLVDLIADMGGGGTFSLWAASIWVPLFLYFFINVVADSAETLQLLQITVLRDEVAFEIERRTIRKTLSHHDLGVFDRSDVKEAFTLAKESTQHGQYLIQLLSNLATGLLLAIPTLIISGSLGLWIPLLVLLTTVPATLMQLRYEGKSWEVEQEHVGLNNRIHETRSAMLNPRFGADMRSHLMHLTLLPRWTASARELIGLRRAVRSRGAYRVLFLAVLSGFGLLIPYGYVIQQALTGNLSVGTLALFIGLVPELRRSLFIVCGNATEIIGAAKQLDGLRIYEETSPQIALDPSATIPPPIAAGVAPSISLSDVTFSYDRWSEAQLALDHVSLALPAGSSTLIVGENGAGKTTVAKMVSRLYDPTTGTVTADGVDLREVAILEHRKRTAVLVQDPARLPLTVRESLSIDLPDVPEHLMLEALRRVGLADKIAQSPLGLDTELSTTLNAGVDLSGGQWQRLAMARFFLQLPFASLVVIDEPTTALDPVADRRLSVDILEQCNGKTSLIVSHRLQIAPLVDQVVLMDQGCVVGVGPHRELVETNAVYREMCYAAGEIPAT